MVDNIDDIELPNMELPDGTLFYLYDNEKSGDRLIILGAKRGLKVVSRSKILLTDGTFKYAPSTVNSKGKLVSAICDTCRVYGNRRNFSLLILSHATQEKREL